MFDLGQFVAECRAAVEADATHKAVREVVARAVFDPVGVIAGLGEPERAGVQKLYCSDNLTVLNVIWGPGMTIMPHPKTQKTAPQNHPKGSKVLRGAPLAGAGYLTGTAR
jgi:hypothetical protein